MIRIVAAVSLAVALGLSPATAHRYTVVVGAGALPTGETFELMAHDFGDADGGIVRYRPSPSESEILIDVDCVAVSWSAVPPRLSHMIAVGGVDAGGKRHQAVFYDAAPGTLVIDRARFMEPGDDACGTTFGLLHLVDGFIDAT